MMNKGIVIFIIGLFIGAGVWPIANADADVFSSFNRNTTDSNNEDLVKVTCQVNMPIGGKEIFKEIPKYRVITIITLSDEINNLLETSSKVEDIKEKIIELEVELKQAEIIPKTIDLEDVLEIIINKNEKTRFLESNYYQNNFITTNETKHNWFNLVFGVSKNITSSILWVRTVPWILLSDFIEKNLDRNPKLLNFFIYLSFIRPKIIGWHIGWRSNGYASIKTIGLNGIKTLDNFGAGIYYIDMLGFIGISMHLGKYGGFIIGFSLSSSIEYIEPT
ncbi:MAG: hypothetical protein MUO82_03600 [Candidatus Thermoplasmatota archaeon]|nr:hypothetical protein [Candidatus Thermoplasmatota archaeon]